MDKRGVNALRSATPDIVVPGSSLAEASNRRDGRRPLGSGLEEVPQTSKAEVGATIAPRPARRWT